MNMQTTEANIDITRKDGKLISISVVMPMWDKVGIDDVININIPLFGIKTFAANLIDVDVAIEEAIRIFCIATEKYGVGLENELRILGWSFNEEKENTISMTYYVSDNNIVMEQIMETGEQFSNTQSFELAY